MARILSTTAVCLRSTPWRETSKLVSFFTNDYGKLVLQAKGARRPKSKFGAALEVLTHSRIIFYKREARHINTLSDAEILEDFPILRSDEQRLRAGAIMAEFTNRHFEPESPSPGVFRLLLQALRALNFAPQHATSDAQLHYADVAFSYLFKVVGRLGFAPQLEHCLSCRRKKAAAFSPRLGGLLCSRCAARDPDSIRVTAPILRSLHRLYYGAFEENLWAPDSRHSMTGRLAFELIIQYLRYHLDRFDLKSLAYSV